MVPVIDVASTSTFLNPADMEKTFTGELQGCYLYSRHSNPSVNAFGKKFAALEGTEAALGVSSGMAAIACSIRIPSASHRCTKLTACPFCAKAFAGVWALPEGCNCAHIAAGAHIVRVTACKSRWLGREHSRNRLVPHNGQTTACILRR